MSAAPPPPAADPTAPPPATDKPASAWDKLAVGASMTGVGILLILPVVFAIVFHIGAGYLSYQKYGSILWAILDVLFAVFYYPYYAFFLAKDPGPSMGMMGGRRRRY